MDKNLVNQMIAAHGSKLPAECLTMVREELIKMDEGTAYVCMSQMKDPVIVILISIFLGTLGIDRIYIGDTLIGVLKLITCGGLGIWTIIDLFLIMNATKQNNFTKFTLFASRGY